MRNIKEIYNWSKITHENVQEFYKNTKNNTNTLENFHRGCAMMAHLRFLSNDDFKELPKRFEQFGLYKPKDYYCFMETLVILKIFDVNMLNKSILPIVETYYEQFKRINNKGE